MKTLLEKPSFTAELSRLRNGVGVLDLAGEIDIATAPILAPRFEVLAHQDLTRLVVDATNVTFMDSAGVHALVDGKKAVDGKNIRFVLVASRPVERVLDLVLSEPLFAMRCESRKEALRELGVGV